jgi:hypothetical protein
MDRITCQSPRQRGYGSTSSLRNDSLKHTRKHERREESNQEAKHTRSGGPCGKEGRTVRTGHADRPACRRRPSAPTPRTVRPYAAVRPIKHTEPPEAHREQRTVRGEHADCPPGTRGPSAQHMRTVRNFIQPKLKTTRNRNERRARTRRTPDEHARHGPSARTTRTVREARTEHKNSPTSKVNSPKSSSDIPNG